MVGQVAGQTGEIYKKAPLMQRDMSFGALAEQAKGAGFVPSWVPNWLLQFIVSVVGTGGGFN